jgi:hypothetical protein
MKSMALVWPKKSDAPFPARRDAKMVTPGEVKPAASGRAAFIGDDDDADADGRRWTLKDLGEQVRMAQVWPTEEHRALRDFICGSAVVAAYARARSRR